LYLWAAFTNLYLNSSLAKISSACLLIASLRASFLPSAFSNFLYSSRAALCSATFLASSAASSASLRASDFYFFSCPSLAILDSISSSVFLLTSSIFLSISIFISFSTYSLMSFLIYSTSLGSLRSGFNSLIYLSCFFCSAYSSFLGGAGSGFFSSFLSSFFSSFFSSFLSSDSST